MCALTDYEINTCPAIELRLSSRVQDNWPLTLVKYCSNQKRIVKVINNRFMLSFWGHSVQSTRNNHLQTVSILYIYIYLLAGFELNISYANFVTYI